MPSARDFMLCWNPGTDEVAIVRHPDTIDASRPYCCTHFACWTWWRTVTFEERKKFIFIEAYHLIVADGCDPAAVHRALWPLDEYRDGLAEDFPKPDAPNRYRGMPFRPEAPTRKAATATKRET